MERPVVIYASLFSKKTDRDFSQKAILCLLEALVRINQVYLQSYRTPTLYKSGVRYVHEEGTENWQAIPDIIANHGGDCEDLACWRAAELREAGYKRTRAFLRWRKLPESAGMGSNFWLYHVLVRHEDGTMEDPSRKLGMRKDQ